MPRVEQLPLVRDYVFVQGSTWKRRFVYKPGGVPMIFIGWTALMQIRDKNGTLLTQASSVPNGGIVLGATDGIIDIEFDEPKTRLVDRSGIYALELHGPSETIPFLRGRIRNLAEVSI